MPKVSVKYTGILGGRAPSKYFVGPNQYQYSVGVDVDLPVSSSDVITGGIATPTAYAKFSGANVNSSSIGFVTSPKTTLVYTALDNGKFISYSSSFGSETVIGTVTGSVANGIVYYNNYIYIMTGTDVSRYGPLDGSPSLVNTVWTGATLGSLTALTNTTYPTLRQMKLPNHWGCVHGDGALYFLDFKNGQGLVHKIKTTKVTDEGDTNDGSAYNVLDLPFGFYPTSITSFGTDIAITAIQTIDSTLNQGPANLFLWDTTNTDSFYRQIVLPDPLATALLYNNGYLTIFSGNNQNGVRVSQYVGGDTVQDVAYLEEGMPPFAGAVDALGGRINWGGFTATPTVSASVFALGSKIKGLGQGIHNVAKASSSGTSPIVTAVKYLQQSSNVTPQVVIGWEDASGAGIDKRSTTDTLSSVIRFPLISVGKKFKVTKLRIPLGGAIDANTSIIPKIYIDDESTSSTLATINNTNYPSKRKVIYRTPELASVTGENNFYLELTWGSTTAMPVLFPIEFDIEIFPDEA